jgi:hypothetical protein
VRGSRNWIATRFTEVDDNNLTAFRRGWVGLETAAGAFTNMLGARRAPILTPIINQFSDWIAVNREWIANWITEHVKAAIGWLRAHKEQIKAAIRVTGEWIDKLGGLNFVLLTLAAVTVGPFLLGILSFTAVLRLAWAFSVTLVAAIRAAGEALIAFNARAMALPVFASSLSKVEPADLYDKAKEGTPICWTRQLAAAAAGQDAAFAWQALASVGVAGPDAAGTATAATNRLRAAEASGRTVAGLSAVSGRNAGKRAGRAERHAASCSCRPLARRWRHKATCRQGRMSGSKAK